MRIKRNQWMKKPVAFILALTLIIGTFGVSGMGESQVYGGEATTADVARESLLKATAYYSEQKNWELTTWEELLAIYAASNLSESDVVLKEWALPPSPRVTVNPKGYLPVIVDAVIKGKSAVAQAAATSLSAIATSGGAVFSEHSDVQAHCMLALEIASGSGLSVPGTYNQSKAAEYLMQMQDDQTGGFSGEYDGQLRTVDTAGYVALAIAPHANKIEFQDTVALLVDFFESKQLENGGFLYEYEGGDGYEGGKYESANSTALAVWGLSALRTATTSDLVHTSISAILTEALPALTKRQNDDGSFNNGWSSEFDSLATRQIMIALYAIATEGTIFSEIQGNSGALVSTDVRIESSEHLPIVTKVSAAKGDSLASTAALAWGKQSSNSFMLEAYRYWLNDSSATSQAALQAEENQILLVDRSVVTRAAFVERSMSNSLNTEKTIQLIDASSKEPLEGVVITVDGAFAGSDAITWEPLATDGQGRLTIPADQFLKAKTYQISTSSAGVSKDLLEINIEEGEPETKKVSVRIEGIDRNILNEELVVVTTSGIKKITALDAINKVLDENEIAATIYDSGWIDSIGGIDTNYFGGTGNEYDYWNFFINGRFSGMGIGNYVVEDGDAILLFYGNSNTTLVQPTCHYSSGDLEVQIPGIAGASVSLSQEDLMAVLEAETNEDGDVRFTNVTPGVYHLEVEKFSTSISRDGLYLPLFVRLAPTHTVTLYNEKTLNENTEALDLSLVSQTSPQAITVGSETSNPRIKVSTSSGVKLPEIRVISDDAKGMLLIPGGTAVTASSDAWDGTISLPKTTKATLRGKTVHTAIHVGSAKYDLIFDQPVRLVLPGAGDKKVGFIDAAGEFSEITHTLTVDSASRAASELAFLEAQEGKYVSGSDMVIWTRHFTTVIAYSDTASPGGGSTVDTVTLSVKGYNGQRILGTTTVEIGRGDTPITILEKAGLSASLDGGYVSSIEGLSEFDHGPESGWKYSVNGEFPARSASTFRLKNGDRVVWQFVTDVDEGEPIQVVPVVLEEITEEEIDDALQRFLDVPRDAWYAEAVGALVCQGVLSGRSDTRFAPEKCITRAEFAMILAKVSGAIFDEDVDSTFRDVRRGQWYHAAITWAETVGLVAGYDDGKGNRIYRPDEKMTRQDLAVMMHRFLAKQTVELEEEHGGEKNQPFIDQEQIADYAREATLYLQSKGLLSGVETVKGAVSFLPKNSATRAETAVIIYKVLQDVEDNR